MWDEIYLRHYPELVRYAASVCKNVQQAEDVAQEVFLKALKNAHIFEDLSDAQQRAWLYRALKNYMIDCFRRAKLESEYLDTIPEEAAYDDTRIQETENQLLLAMLTPEDRALFHLRYEEGYNASELSEMLGMPPGTVRARLSRCRAILKKQLSDI